MKRRTLLAMFATMLLSGGAFAQPAGDLPAVDDNTPIYGSQIMTPQERVEHRQRMRAAKTLEEREQIRIEHHEQMVRRAKERGVTLPEEPPMRGGGMMGPGGGAGSGGGMGPGGGPGDRERLGPADRMGPRGMGSGGGMGAGPGGGPNR